MIRSLPLGLRMFAPSIPDANLNRQSMRLLLVAVVSLFGFFANDARAGVVLTSVDWTQMAPEPTASIGGTWSFGSVIGTTGAFANAGKVFPATWGNLPFSAGYSTTINEGISLGVNANATQKQTFSFSGPISSVFLFFNYTDANTSFNFGTYNWYLVGANNAHRSGNTVVIDSTSNSENDGFLINIVETFDSNRNLEFDFVNNTGAVQSVAFNLGQGPAVPEPSSFAIALAGVAFGGFSKWRRRKRA